MSKSKAAKLVSQSSKFHKRQELEKLYDTIKVKAVDRYEREKNSNLPVK